MSLQSCKSHERYPMLIDKLEEWYHREYDAGKLAATEGKRAKDNPHSQSCIFHHWWKQGFFENIGD